MTYRHIYHAGNFADALKHAVLVALIEQLKLKQTPFCVFDTHAGAGSYDASAPEAIQGGEFGSGVRPLLGARQLPVSMHAWLNLVRSFNTGANQPLQHYPGSPLIAASLLRPDDQLLLCELQAAEAAQLRRLFSADPRVHVHCRDGYEALGALLPPPQRRGLVLIDPPFEAQDAEYDHILRGLRSALKRWPTGIYAIWYPIKLRQTIQRFHRRLVENAIPRLLIGELCLHPDDSALRLNGCGMLIVNPPWRFERVLGEILDALLAHLGQGRYARRQLQWLAGERVEPQRPGPSARAARPGTSARDGTRPRPAQRKRSPR